MTRFGTALMTVFVKRARGMQRGGMLLLMLMISVLFGGVGSAAKSGACVSFDLEQRDSPWSAPAERSVDGTLDPLLESYWLESQKLGYIQSGVVLQSVSNISGKKVIEFAATARDTSVLSKRISGSLDAPLLLKGTD